MFLFNAKICRFGYICPSWNAIDIRDNDGDEETVTCGFKYSRKGQSVSLFPTVIGEDETELKKFFMGIKQTKPIKHF